MHGGKIRRSRLAKLLLLLGWTGASFAKINVMCDGPKSYSSTLYHYAAGELALARENVHEAERHLRAAGDSPWVSKALLRLMVHAGQVEGIEQLPAGHFDEKDLESQLLFARAHVHAHRFEQAENILKKLEGKYASNKQVTYYLVMVYVGQKKYDEALGAIERAVKQEPESISQAPLLLLRAKIEYQIQKIVQAQQTLERVLILDPHLEKAWLLKALLLEREGNVIEAAAAYKKALDYGEYDDEVARHVVELLFNAGRYADAEELLIEMDDPSVEHGVDLALVQLKGKAYVRALNSIKKARAVDGEYLKAQLLHLEILVALKDKKAFEAEVQDQLVQYPTHVEIYQKLMESAAFVGLSAITRILAHVAQQHPREGVACAALVDAHNKTNNHREVIAAAHRLVSITKDAGLLSKTYLIMGNAYRTLGDAGRAEESFERAVAQREIYYPAYNALAYSYCMRNRNIEKAEALIKRALQREPNNPVFLDTHGMILSRMGDRRAAQRVLRGALGAAPTNTIIKQHAVELGE